MNLGFAGLGFCGQKFLEPEVRPHCMPMCNIIILNIFNFLNPTIV